MTDLKVFMLKQNNQDQVKMINSEISFRIRLRNKVLQYLYILVKCYYIYLYGFISEFFLVQMLLQ